MSTRSNIAIEDPKTKKVKVIYVHSDGYPYGVGKCLVDYYSKPDVAKLLFNHGDASYLGDTIDACSFYSRDWNRDEWMYMFDMRGNIFIEYVYLFKDNRWHVSTSKIIRPKDAYDGYVGYKSKFEPVIINKEYIKYKDKHEKHAEVKMIGQIGKLLSGAGFSGDDIQIQGGNVKKKAN